MTTGLVHRQRLVMPQRHRWSHLITCRRSGYYGSRECCRTRKALSKHTNHLRYWPAAQWTRAAGLHLRRTTTANALMATGNDRTFRREIEADDANCGRRAPAVICSSIRSIAENVAELTSTAGTKAALDHERNGYDQNGQCKNCPLENNA